MMQKFAIHGLPRSGSTWVGEIFNSSPQVCYRYQPLFSYAMKGFLSEGSTSDQIDEFYHELSVNEDSFLCQNAARGSGRLPIFKKQKITHVGYKEVRYHHVLPNLIRQSMGVKFILIQRNPFSVISSWLNAPREFRGDLGWDRLEEWRYALKKNINRPEEFNGYEKWKEASLLFHYLAKNNPDQVLVLRYDELLKNTEGLVRQAFEFIGLDYMEQTDTFIHQETSENKDAYSVLRSRQTDDKWKTELEPEIIESIKSDLKGSAIEYLLPAVE